MLESENEKRCSNNHPFVRPSIEITISEARNESSKDPLFLAYLSKFYFSSLDKN